MATNNAWSMYTMLLQHVTIILDRTIRAYLVGDPPSHKTKAISH